VSTSGGKAPTSGCVTPNDIAKRELMPYEADYVFFREKPVNRRD
jgi:hypothetical protein